MTSSGADAGGTTSGQVTITTARCAVVLELPPGMPIASVLSRATELFGPGWFEDSTGARVTDAHAGLPVSKYKDALWIAPPKKPACEPADESYELVSYALLPDESGLFRFSTLASIAGFKGSHPRALFLGNPPIMRIDAPAQGDKVPIDTGSLGTLGTEADPVDISGLGFWAGLLECVWGSVKLHQNDGGPVKEN